MELQQQLSEIKKLQQQCEAEENLQLKLNWDMLEQRDGNRKEDFFIMRKGSFAPSWGSMDLEAKLNYVKWCFPPAAEKEFLQSF